MRLLSCMCCASEKAVTQMQKDREQMLRKISENDGQLTQVVAQHSATKARLEEQELTFMEQQTARVSGNICACAVYTARLIVYKEKARV